MRIKLKAEALSNYKVLDKHWLLLLADRKFNKDNPGKRLGKERQIDRLSGDIKGSVGEMLALLHSHRSPHVWLCSCFSASC